MKQSTLHHSKKKVFDAVKAAAKNLDLEIEQSLAADGTLSLVSGGGLFSYGNNISVEIKSEYSKTVLKVTSKSAAEIQLIDWGTNSNLESNLIEEVKNILKG